MEIIGFAAALFIGIILGLIGGGGSIMTVPVLVYLMGLNPVTATAYSLFVVGITSLFGSIGNLKRKEVDLKMAIVFAIPSLLSVYFTRKYLIYNLPEILFTVGDFQVSKNLFLMILFALIMVMTSYSMLKKDFCRDCGDDSGKFNYPLIIAEGIGVGIITGLVGAGGGFLIIPALVFFARLPIKKAVATSLIIIAAKSLIGFVGDVQNIEIEWNILLPFTLISVIGIFLGIYLTRFVNDEKLKKAFGWFVLLMGIYIIINELIIGL